MNTSNRDVGVGGRPDVADERRTKEVSETAALGASGRPCRLQGV